MANENGVDRASGGTNIFRIGQAHMEEMARLIEDTSITPEEHAAILTQIDLLYRGAIMLKPATSQLPDCRILAHICRTDGLEAMVKAGVAPRLIRALRKRRAKTYALYLSRLSDEACSRTKRAARSACRAGEWKLCLCHTMRCLRVRGNLLLLRAARSVYLAGFSVDIHPTLKRLKLLLERP